MASHGCAKKTTVSSSVALRNPIKGVIPNRFKAPKPNGVPGWSGFAVTGTSNTPFPP